jgi:hypothetical protein
MPGHFQTLFSKSEKFGDLYPFNFPRMRLFRKKHQRGLPVYCELNPSHNEDPSCYALRFVTKVSRGLGKANPKGRRVGFANLIYRLGAIGPVVWQTAREDLW